MVDKATIISAIANYGFKIAMGMFAKDDFDAAVGEMTGGGIQGNSFLNSFTGGQGLTGLLKNQAKKFGVNQGLKALTGGSSGITGALPLFGAALGLGYMTNPLREGSYNYNPNLQGQLDYAGGLDGYLGRNPNSGLLQYGPNSVLSGQGAVSGFGTNDYRQQLQNYIDKMETRKTKGYNTIGIGPFQAKTTNFTDFQQSQLDKAKEEQDNFDWDQLDKDMAQEASIKAGVQSANDDTPSNEGGGGGTNNAQHGSSGMSKSQHSAFRAARGGIASLWQR